MSGGSPNSSTWKSGPISLLPCGADHSTTWWSRARPDHRRARSEAIAQNNDADAARQIIRSRKRAAMQDGRTQQPTVVRTHLTNAELLRSTSAGVIYEVVTESGDILRDAGLRKLKTKTGTLQTQPGRWPLTLAARALACNCLEACSNQHTT